MVTSRGGATTTVAAATLTAVLAVQALEVLPDTAQACFHSSPATTLEAARVAPALPQALQVVPPGVLQGHS